MKDNNVIDFIKSCIQQRNILWTYHVNMRLKSRFIPRKFILDSLNTYEIIEEYPDDRYLPSYLIYARHEREVIHIQIATDIEKNNIRVVTSYKPTLDKWNDDFKTRRKS